MEDFVDLNGEIIPCSSEFLDYLQENIPLLEVYLATLKYPFSKNEDYCIKYNSYKVKVNDIDSDLDGEIYSEKSFKNSYRIYSDRIFYFNICPFHINNTYNYSFMIDDKKNLFYCHGCGTSGSAFEFIREIYRLNDLETVKVLSTLLYLKKEELDEFCVKSLERLGIPNELSSIEKEVSLNLFKCTTDYEKLIKEANEKRQQLLERIDQYVEKLYVSGRLDIIVEYFDDNFIDRNIEEKIRKMANRICVGKNLFEERVKLYKKQL